jgi:hypothetical protein
MQDGKAQLVLYRYYWLHYWLHYWLYYWLYYRRHTAKPAQLDVCMNWHSWKCEIDVVLLLTSIAVTVPLAWPERE